MLAAAYFSVQYNKKLQNQEQAHNMILKPGQAENIQGFEFKAGSQQVQINYDEQFGWQVSSRGRVPYPADMSKVKKMVQKLSGHEFIPSQHKQNSDTVDLQVRFSDSTRQNIAISKQRAVDGSSFIMTNDKKYVAESFWQNLVSQFEFRQREVYLLNGNLAKINIGRQGEQISYELDEKKQLWVPNKKQLNTIKDESMVGFFRQLMQVKVFRFFDDKQVSRDNHQQLGLEAPLFKLNFQHSEGQQEWTLLVSKEDHGKHYGFIEHLQVYFQLTPESMNHLKSAINFLN